MQKKKKKEEGRDVSQRQYLKYFISRYNTTTNQSGILTILTIPFWNRKDTVLFHNPSLTPPVHAGWVPWMELIFLHTGGQNAH